MKSKGDILNIGKLKATWVALCNLSDVVKNEVERKTKYNAQIKAIEDEIHDITNLATNTTLNAKINEVKSKITTAQWRKSKF